MSEINRKTNNRLRELVNIAYENEANIRLRELNKCFDDWRNDLLSSGELLSLVHEFGHRQSKAMIDMYDQLEPELLIARAVVEGLLSEDEISKELSGRIRRMIEFYREKMSQH